MIHRFAASNPNVKVAIVSRPQDEDTNEEMREYRLLRLDHSTFDKLPFCTNNISDKRLTQNDLEYLYQSYIQGNIPIDTYKFHTIGHNANIAGDIHKASINHTNIHMQLCKFYVVSYSLGILVSHPN